MLGTVTGPLGNLLPAGYITKIISQRLSQGRYRNTKPSDSCGWMCVWPRPVTISLSVWSTNSTRSRARRHASTFGVTGSYTLGLPSGRLEWPGLKIPPLSLLYSFKT